MKIVAMVTRSAGNAEVGSMWTETKICNKDDTLESVIRWALKQTHNDGGCLQETLTLQIADEEADK